jgi:hypothetical protein
MENQVSTNDVFLYHKTTGCPVLEAKNLLAEMDPSLLVRVLRAALEQSGNDDLLYDPIENDPAIREIIAQAATAAKDVVLSQGPLRMGSCHGIWREQARILKEEHGIDWFSPQKMNPSVCFD